MKVFIALAFVLTVVSAAIRPNNNGARIIGGQQAERGQFKYQAQLQYLNGHQCGGSIIAPNWVLTAAHCVTGLAISYNVVANQYDILTAEGMERKQIGQRIVRHPNYNSTNFSNDIALIRVNNPMYVVNDTVVEPIALPRQGADSIQGSLSTVSGWGITAEGSSVLPRFLRFVEVPVVSDAECRSSYGESMIHDSMICAGYVEGGRDACNGDSGGPMVCSDAEGEAYLCGIVSWGNGCARPYYFGVYTEVSAYTNWILNNID